MWRQFRKTQCCSAIRKGLERIQADFSQIQSRDMQLEKGVLMIVFLIRNISTIHIYIYIYNCWKIKIDVDHKPLEAIVNELLAKSSKRIHGMLLGTQKYDINIVYVIWKLIYIVAMLSRPFRQARSSGRNLNMSTSLVFYWSVIKGWHWYTEQQITAYW